MTRFALASTLGGMLRPICFAVLRLIASSELRRLLDRKIRRFCAFENLIHVSSGAAKQVRKVRPVRHEATNLYILSVWIHRWLSTFSREINDPCSVIIVD